MTSVSTVLGMGIPEERAFFGGGGTSGSGEVAPCTTWTTMVEGAPAAAGATAAALACRSL